MKKTIISLLAATLTLTSGSVAAQYYTTGQSPASQKWMSVRGERVRVVFPREYEAGAREAMFYMEAMFPDINHGYELPPLKTPVVVRTENFSSNGLAMLAPRRIEFIGIPSSKTYAEPWLKQLAVHEYRHMVQYGNINRSTVKVAGWLLGDQARLLATGLLPFWFIEGDAVMTETQASEFGRALQPSFNMHYRTLGRDILRGRNIDKWFCGSYRDFVPSHYELGYQIVSYADRHLDGSLGAALTRYTSDYPFLIFTTQLALRKHFDTSTKELFRNTFEELNDLWDSLPEQDDSAEIVSPAVQCYTTYSYPQYIGDDRLLVLKRDSDRASRFVIIDLESGEESVVAYTGDVSSRPSYRDGEVWWTEYNPTMWEQKVDSKVRWMKLDEGTPRAWPGSDRALYVTPIPSGSVARVDYHYGGYFSIVVGDRSLDFPGGVSIHGLAWCDDTERIYFIALDDDGMSIGEADFSTTTPTSRRLTAPSRVAISDLSAGGGRLYFGSTASGRDEIHAIDIASGREWQLTTSRYGSFGASPMPGGGLALTTYNRAGYMAAVQREELAIPVAPAHLPLNVVNIAPKAWGITRMDELTYPGYGSESRESGVVGTSGEQTDAHVTPQAGTTTNSRVDTREYAQVDNSAEQAGGNVAAVDADTRPQAKKFRRGLNLFNVHSWAPGYYSPEGLISDLSFDDIQLGATVISQSLLGDTQADASYGRLRDGHSLVRGHLGYYGWAPKIEVSALWSDRPHSYNDLATSVTSPRGNSLNISSRVYLPLTLGSGYWRQSLTPSVQAAFTNDELHSASGVQRQLFFAASLQYSASVIPARLDLQPRWGYSLRASIVGNPFSRLYTNARSLYGRVYAPGVALHHGVTIQAAYQKAFGTDGDATDDGATNGVGKMLFGVTDMLPHGADNIFPERYLALSADYRLPVAYPNIGLGGIFFLKRISVAAGYDFARYTVRENGLPVTGNMNSVGGTLYLEIVPFRMPAQSATTLSIGLWKHSADSCPYMTFGFSVPL